MLFRSTRPPLSFKESKLPFGFVRLACVKHAASVHPEPGSNSQINFESRLALLLFLNSILRIEKVRFTSSFAFYSIVKIRAFLRCLRHTLACPSDKVLDYSNSVPPICQELFCIFSKKIQLL